MSNNTKSTFIISLISFVLTSAICGFLFFEINAQGVRLDNNVALLKSNNKKDYTHLNITRTMQETEAQRTELSTKFLRDANDSITFLDEMEALAPTLGLTLRTESIDDTIADKEKGLKFFKVVFVYVGEKDAVKDFVRILENIHYHSYLESLSLKSIAGDTWEGEATILITMQTP
ncbi:MAG: hypothetical protein H6779_02420 [Candidatus Nomurabacteria bacterium]|nr:hypothetical protein [Candidatus Nomurabacteria bacterium]USN88277.1 MAG: hypothetical protein H6779_02420 [Candidatus Nomurabacteria bacterium]